MSQRCARRISAGDPVPHQHSTGDGCKLPQSHRVSAGTQLGSEPCVSGDAGDGFVWGLRSFLHAENTSHVNWYHPQNLKVVPWPLQWSCHSSRTRLGFARALNAQLKGLKCVGEFWEQLLWSLRGSPASLRWKAALTLVFKWEGGRWRASLADFPALYLHSALHNWPKWLWMWKMMFLNRFAKMKVQSGGRREQLLAQILGVVGRIC